MPGIVVMRVGMDSGRFGLAIVLVIAVIVLTNILFPPVRPEEPAAPAGAPDVEAVAPERPAAVRETPPAAGAAALEAGVAVDTITAVSPLYAYTFSTLGGSVIGAELFRFESGVREGPVQLAPESGAPLLGYELWVDGEAVDLRRVLFRTEAPDTILVREGQAPETFRLIGEDPATGITVRLEYTISPDDYLVDVRGEVEGLSGRGTSLLVLDLAPALGVNEANEEEDRRSFAYAVRGRRNGVRSTMLSRIKAERIEEGPLEWVALRSKYFLLAAVKASDEAATEFGGLIARPTSEPNAADLRATLPLGTDRTFAFRLYLGPQEYNRLAEVGYGLQDVNPYGWRVLRPIIRPLAQLLTWALIGMQQALGLGYGWVVILFGVLIRLLLWPLNARAMRSQMKNMALQPRIQEIQTKYKNDPQKLQQEMLRLYREEGFNPLGGCLPMLIPFPVLITLFFVFQNTIEFRGVEFLWLPDLSRPDPYFVLPIILGVSMFAMQWISAKVTPPNPQMKMMMYFMPAFMVVIFLNLSSGLNLYYAAQNLASIPQQIQITRERQRLQAAKR